MKSYFLSVICAAFLCGITGGLIDKKGNAGTLLKLISGIFLAFTVIRPIADIKVEELSIFTTDLMAEGESAAAMGEEITRDAMASIIKQETQAYILDKAGLFGLILTADVSLDASLKPVSVILTGNAIITQREKLSDIIENDLGISKENQRWIG